MNIQLACTLLYRKLELCTNVIYNKICVSVSKNIVICNNKNIHA